MKFLITQSLISAFHYAQKFDDMTGFMNALNRKKTPESEAMQAGKLFERLIMLAMLQDEPPKGVPADLWACASEFAEETAGGAYQVKAYETVFVDGSSYLIHGVMDALLCGVIFDYKFMEAYAKGKNTRMQTFLDSPQPSFYFTLCPKATEMRYLISDGHYNYREFYHPDEVQSAEVVIRQFVRVLKSAGLMDIYETKWRA